jgi:hypothetical protein
MNRLGAFARDVQKKKAQVSLSPFFVESGAPGRI